MNESNCIESKYCFVFVQIDGEHMTRLSCPTCAKNKYLKSLFNQEKSVYFHVFFLFFLLPIRSRATTPRNLMTINRKTPFKILVSFASQLCILIFYIFCTCFEKQIKENIGGGEKSHKLPSWLRDELEKMKQKKLETSNKETKLNVRRSTM